MDCAERVLDVEVDEGCGRPRARCSAYFSNLGFLAIVASSAKLVSTKLASTHGNLDRTLAAVATCQNTNIAKASV